MPSLIQQTARPLGLALLLRAGASALGCRGPSLIDEECIKGRISNEQAEPLCATRPAFIAARLR